MQRINATKTIGCLFGGAIGDALGMPYTGMNRAEIVALGGVSEFAPARTTAPVSIPLTALADPELDDLLEPGQWTDDTQLTLALADALIEEGGLFVPDTWAHALVRWLNNAPHGPGLASVQAAIQLRTGGAEWDEAADPDGGGCGAATRVAPVALLYPDDPPARRRIAMLQAMTTHGSPDAQAAAVAVAEAVALVLPLEPAAVADWDGAALLQAAVNAVRAQSPAFEEFARCLEGAQAMLADDVEVETAVRVLGVSAWSREAVPTALYLAARLPRDPEALILGAVTLTGGAVESIAAIVGAIAGALHGVTRLPGRWRRGVEDAPRLLSTALALHGLAEARRGP
ncbi:MAG TPA: ADP-ribosylglycohydrolase family protein [Chthonomonadaceae bacterium]|nr:ADP-ribosylglycohydrolase family protein [Chthonomonadaceae bacterium]